MLILRNTLLHLRIGLFSAIFLAMLLLGCTASPMHAADEAEKFAPEVPGVKPRAFKLVADVGGPSGGAMAWVGKEDF